MNTQIPIFEKTIELVPGKIGCSIKEFWEDIDTAQRAYCGTPDKFTVKKTRGMSIREREALKSALGSSLGVKGFVEVKGKIEGELSKEVEWESSYEVAREFNVIPPKCGWKEIAVYQLVRIYDFRFTERRLFGGERTWSRTFKERTERYSGEPFEEPFDPRCNCPTRPKIVDLIGRTKILLEHANISLRVPSWVAGPGIKIQIDGHDLEMPSERFREGMVEISASWLPDYMRFLGDLPDDDTALKFAVSDKHVFIDYEDPFDLRSIIFESEVIKSLKTVKLHEEEPGFGSFR